MTPERFATDASSGPRAEQWCASFDGDSPAFFDAPHSRTRHVPCPSGRRPDEPDPARGSP